MEGSTVNRSYKGRGFTVVELMIVVALVAILAAIAVSFYGDMVIRARRADGKAALEEVALLQEQFRANNIAYTTNLTQSQTGTPAGLGYSGTSGCAACSHKGYYALTISASSATGFTVSAAPTGSHSDPECGTLTLTVNGGAQTRTNSAGDTDKCWNR